MIECTASEWTLAEDFLRKLSKALNALKKPKDTVFSPNSTTSSSKGTKRLKKKLKRKVAKKKTLN